MSYNGWTNYETWAVKLWLDNDYGSYAYYREQARATDDAYTLGQQLRDDFEENNPIENASVYADLLSAALSEVDWHEIAASLLEDVQEEDEYEDA